MKSEERNCPKVELDFFRMNSQCCWSSACVVQRWLSKSLGSVGVNDTSELVQNRCSFFYDLRSGQGFYPAAGPHTSQEHLQDLHPIIEKKYHSEGRHEGIRLPPSWRINKISTCIDLGL